MSRTQKMASLYGLKSSQQGSGKRRFVLVSLLPILLAAMSVSSVNSAMQTLPRPSQHEATSHA